MGSIEHISDDDIRWPARTPEAIERQRIARQNERLFRLFVFCLVLICALILLAMLLPRHSR